VSSVIFISYRRDDSSAFAGRLYDRLVERYGMDQVFMDVDNIPPGVDFAEAIAQAVGTCDVLLAVIGQHWLTVTGQDGRRRLDNPRDMVRLEVEAALTRDVPVIPVLVGGAAMPPEQELPEGLGALALRNGLNIRHETFGADLQRLAAAIDRIEGAATSASSAFPDVAGEATSASLALSSGRGALALEAEYSWTLESIMWALPRQPAPEDEPVIEAPDLVGNLDAQGRLEALLAKRDGVKIGADSFGEQRPFSELRLIATGQHSRPVLITGMRANVSKREPPLSETIVFGPPEGAGENIQIGFDLDSLTPIARGFDSEMLFAGPYFAAHHVSLRNGEQAIFSIRAYTGNFYCEWELLVEAIIDGVSKVFLVRNGNRPFRTTAFASSYRTAYKFDFMASQFVRLQPGATLFG
jgi:hypothetical protein